MIISTSIPWIMNLLLQTIMNELKMVSKFNQVKNGSVQGLFSINMFGFDTPEMNEHRTTQVVYEKKKLKQALSVQDKS